MAVQTQIQVRRGTASSWTSTNPTLAAGEWGLETDTGKYKVGDGSSVWTGLGYASILPSTVTTKGDLLAATGSGAVSRLAAGSNGYTLVADSSTSTGLAYSPTFFAGKNKIINGDFFINQRNIDATGSTYGSGGSDGYTLDRWAANYVGGTVTTSCQQFTAGTAPVTGYEAKQFARMVVSGQVEGAGNNYALFYQKIEDVRTFANQQITYSFWAKANTGTPKLALVARQNFGSGGSPSANVDTNLGTVTLSTSWARYSVTGTIPSISGKTIGTTANSSNLQIWIMPSCTTNFAFGQSIGIQNFTMDVWGVQVEAGSTATQFQTATGTIQGELAACQRYYVRFSGSNQTSIGSFGSAASTTVMRTVVPLPATMRVAPTAVDSGGLFWAYDGTNTITVGSFSFYNSSVNLPQITATGTGLTQFRPYVIIAQNDSAAYVGFSAEL